MNAKKYSINVTVNCVLNIYFNCSVIDFDLDTETEVWLTDIKFKCSIRKWFGVPKPGIRFHSKEKLTKQNKNPKSSNIFISNSNKRQEIQLRIIPA